MLQQAADKMSVSQLHGNVCATTSLANATTSLAALALRDDTDVAALALCVLQLGQAGPTVCVVRNRVARTERCLSASTACELGWCPLKSVLAWLC